MSNKGKGAKGEPGGLGDACTTLSREVTSVSL